MVQVSGKAQMYHLQGLKMHIGLPGSFSKKTLQWQNTSPNP